MSGSRAEVLPCQRRSGPRNTDRRRRGTLSPVRAPDAVAVIPTEPPLRCTVASSVGSSTTFQRALCTRWSVRSRNCDVAYVNLSARYGHDSFLVEVKEQTELVRGFLASTLRESGHTREAEHGRP